MRFVVFAYDQYYPAGGWHDKKSSHDTLEEAQAAVYEMRHGERRSRYDYYDIVDVVNDELILTF